MGGTPGEGGRGTAVRIGGGACWNPFSFSDIFVMRFSAFFVFPGAVGWGLLGAAGAPAGGGSRQAGGPGGRSEALGHRDARLAPLGQAEQGRVFPWDRSGAGVLWRRLFFFSFFLPAAGISPSLFASALPCCACPPPRRVRGRCSAGAPTLHARRCCARAPPLGAGAAARGPPPRAGSRRARATPLREGCLRYTRPCSAARGSLRAAALSPAARNLPKWRRHCTQGAAAHGCRCWALPRTAAAVAAARWRRRRP